jgi:arsenical pump membrane protein
MQPTLHPVLIIGIVAVSILLMLARPRGVAEVWWVGAGAVLLVLLRLIPLRLAGAAIAQGSDVYLFLIGMMLLSGLGHEHGVFDWVSAKAARAAKGQCLRLFTLVYGLGLLTTIFLSNDATAVVLTPAVLVVVRKARVQPMPYLFACAMVANAASLVLPISNPANLVVFQQDMPSLGRWLASFAIPAICSIGTVYFVLRWHFRSELRAGMEHEVEDCTLKPSGRLLLWGLGLVAAVLLVASAMNASLGLPTFLSALLIVFIVSLRARCSPVKLLKELSWRTILLVAGLFVLVTAVESIGLLRCTEDALNACRSMTPALGATVVTFTLGVVDNLVNNLPLGLVAGATVHATHVSGLLARAVLLGIDLGPNLSVTGSLATVLWLIALRKEKLDVSAWTFLKVGALVMPLSMLASLAGLLISHWLLHA